jgi:hypothetical protein
MIDGETQTASGNEQVVAPQYSQTYYGQPTQQVIQQQPNQQQYSQQVNQTHQQGQVVADPQQPYQQQPDLYKSLMGGEFKGSPASKYQSLEELIKGHNSLAELVGSKFDKEIPQEQKEALFSAIGNRLSKVPDDPSKYEIDLPNMSDDVKKAFQQQLHELKAGTHQAQPMIDFSVGMAEAYHEQHIETANERNEQISVEVFGQEQHDKRTKITNDVLGMQMMEEVNGASLEQIKEQMKEEGTILGPTAWCLISNLCAIIMGGISPSYSKAQLPVQRMLGGGAGQLNEHQLKLLATGNASTPGYTELRQAIAKASSGNNR